MYSSSSQTKYYYLLELFNKNSFSNFPIIPLKVFKLHMLQVIDHFMEIARKTVEECDFSQGFMLFHSMGGGTGSGLLSLICEQLLNDFPKKSRVQFSIYPSPSYASAVTEPYNAVLATSETLETSDLALMLDNESLYDIIRRVLYQDRPTFSTINRVLAQVSVFVFPFQIKK